jgi:hypothetical protein
VHPEFDPWVQHTRLRALPWGIYLKKNSEIGNGNWDTTCTEDRFPYSVEHSMVKAYRLRDHELRHQEIATNHIYHGKKNS